MRNRVIISNIPAISAIYFALLQTGYEYDHIGRESEHIASVRRFIGTSRIPPFFTNVRQSTCEAYPYWPRAFILEAASFYVADESKGYTSFSRLQNHIMSATNIAEHERDSPLWDWLAAFPQALRAILSSAEYMHYMEWENQWIDQQRLLYENALQQMQTCLNTCAELYSSPIQNIQIIMNPIKCVYASDYHMDGNCFIFSSGSFRLESVIHEFLHRVIHPHVRCMQGHILQTDCNFPNLDPSYLLAGDSMGKCNAFEEYAVRSLTDCIILGHYPTNIAKYLNALCQNQ